MNNNEFSSHFTFFAVGELCIECELELSSFGANPAEPYYKAMLRVLRYCIGSKERGLKVDHNTRWNGKENTLIFK
jgi:hypothetical protein